MNERKLGRPCLNEKPMTAAERKRRQREKEKTYRDTRSDAKKVRVAIWNALWQQVFSELGDCNLPLVCEELETLALHNFTAGACLEGDEPGDKEQAADLLSMADSMREGFERFHRKCGRYGYEEGKSNLRQFFFEALEHPDPWAYWEDVDAAEQAANETN